MIGFRQGRRRRGTRQDIAGSISRPRSSVILMAALVGLFQTIALASDHADPIRLNENSAGLTDLYAFEDPEKTALVVVLCAGRGIDRAAPFPLRPIDFHVCIDRHSDVDFEDPLHNDRYGGRVRNPEGIQADLRITFRLNDDVTLRQRVIDASFDVGDLPPPFVGLRDDPFIFHRFATTNVIAIVQEIPYDRLRRRGPGGIDGFERSPRDLLVWATSDRFGDQTDHVGRSLRTMLPRFDFLNTLPPNGHVPAIRQRHERPGVITDVLATFASPFFGIRHDDFQPDVMIFSRDRPAGYPNGRRLTDDVADLTCRQGDCLLLEVSRAEAAADHVPRPTTNNVPFLEHFPFLAPPNAEPRSFEDPGLRWRTKAILAAIGLVLAIFIALPWWLLYRTRKRLRGISLSLASEK